MNIKNVFVDANIIIDVFDKKRKNNQSSTKVISYLLSIKEINLYTSCDLLTTVYYILKKEDKKNALYNIKDSLDVYKLIPFSNEEVEEAITLMEKNPKFKDLEDTLQYTLAKNNKCNIILTNDENFYSPDTETYTSLKLLQKLNI